jgi:putative N6-adenine-specific DNA methylase
MGVLKDKGFMYKNFVIAYRFKIFCSIYFLRQTMSKLYFIRVNWSRYINAKSNFVIDATVHSDNFNHSEFVSKM